MNFGTYLINLDHREDRLAQAQAELAAAKLSYTRVSAVTQNPSIDSAFLTPSVYACWQSHLKTYALFLESNHEYALIVEDDLEIRTGAKFDNYVTVAKDLNLDLLQIGFLLPGLFNRIRWMYEEIEKYMFFCISVMSRFKPFMNLKGRMRVEEAFSFKLGLTKASFMPGTHAYIIGRKLAQAILEENPRVLSADEFFISLAKMRSFQIARLSLSVVSQNDSEPSITSRYKSWEKS